MVVIDCWPTIMLSTEILQGKCTFLFISFWRHFWQDFEIKEPFFSLLPATFMSSSILEWFWTFYYRFWVKKIKLGIIINALNSPEKYLSMSWKLYSCYNFWGLHKWNLPGLCNLLLFTVYKFLPMALKPAFILANYGGVDIIQ